MYLKKIDIQGFKSFADRIQLEFNSGITSVVGPNGSGKSNIADAVRWVLGEQSAKTLRGAKMEDVIFAGTEHRKQMSFAEVSLTIDNSDNTLPIDFTEVTITRRVFRSGESEYLINKTSCRLKDIHELFLDTGIGKDGYSIIGQGRVDEILSSRSEDRRHIFEEASGIMKYKVRKQEAEKKMDLTEQNLVRINDIINELESQIEPLKQQSETAKRYLDLREKLKELDINIYIENIDKYKEKMLEYDVQLVDVQKNIDDEAAKLEEITTKNKDSTDKIKLLDDELEKAREEFYSIESVIEKSTSDINLNKEKIHSAESNITRLKAEIEEIEEKKKQLTDEDASKVKKLEYLNRKYNEYKEKLSVYEKEMEELLSSLDEKERSIEELKTQIMDSLDKQSDKKTQINSVAHQLEAIKKRYHSIDNEIYQGRLEIDKEGIKKEELQNSISKKKKEKKNLEEKYNLLERERNSLSELIDEKKQNRAKVQAEIHSKGARIKVLKEMENSLEGYGRSVKEILNACRNSKTLGSGIHGALAQLINPFKGFESALEMALGGALQNIVTSTEEDAKKAIEFLKSNKLGRATFLPVSAIKGRNLENDVSYRLKNYNGFEGIASDLLDYDKKYSGIISNLLGRVVVAKNMDSGIKIARDFGFNFKIVTLEGDIINAGGSMTGGSLETRSTGILGRQREITELDAQLKSAYESDRSIEKVLNELNAQITEVDSELIFEQKNLNDYDLIVIRDEAQLASIDDSIARIKSREDMLKIEKDGLSKQEKSVLDEVGKYETELSTIENEIASAKEIISKHQEAHKEEQASRDRMHRDITDFKISVNSIEESRNSVLELSARIGSELESHNKSISRKEHEIQKNSDEINQFSILNESLLIKISDLSEKKTGKNTYFEELQEKKKQLEEHASDIIEKISLFNKNIMLYKEEQGRVEVKKTKLETEMDSILNRMWDEYELTYSTALEFKKDIGSIPQAQKRAGEIRNEIKELGPVNVAAIEEYIKTKERFEFMSIQRDDLENSKEKLAKVIAEMVTLMKKQFMEHFNMINENFSVVFKELFGGGRAELILSDKENILETGIDIEVQPPGKKLQNMMLLSGGERAFTAIALLFAILRLKPTPFCLLDEIEAALDDANVYRFAQYIKKFTDNTQFITVTHRKGTMENSDSLYGVTMQEHGVSRVVSMKLGEKSA